MRFTFIASLIAASRQLITFAGADHLLDGYWWMDHLMITRNKLKQITGFEINSGRIMHVVFNKMERVQSEKMHQ